METFYSYIKEYIKNNNLNDILKNILNTIIKQLNYTKGCFYLFDDDLNIYKLITYSNLSSDFINDNKTIEYNDNNYYKIIKKCKTTSLSKNDKTQNKLLEKWQANLLTFIPVLKNKILVGFIIITCNNETITKQQKDFLDKISLISSSIVSNAMNQNYLLKKIKYLEFENQLLKTKNNIKNFDIITEMVRKHMNLHGMYITYYDKEKNIVSIIGMSTILPKIFHKAIKSIIFDLNKNITALNFFNELNKTKKILIKDLIKLITDDFKVSISSKMISSLIKTLMDTKFGEILIIPIKNNKNNNIGALLLATKSNRLFNNEDIDFINKLTETFSILLEDYKKT